MMIRCNMNGISLKPNDKVSKYVIDSVTGYGASCIVYKAWYKEDNNSEPHWVQLKELYPYDIGFFRDASNNLICKTKEDKKKFDEYKKNFEASNNMLVKLNRLTDSTPCEIQSFPYNGTKYSIVAYSNGKQYSEKELQKMELDKLLGIIESLAISVSRLHEEGYLHLDIKPDNFLINDIGSAILFDVDSVVPVEEIKYRNGISYSKKWAAPEVKYAVKKSDHKDISCKSDIFSIGVILFEAITGRGFLPMETVSYNRNWDIEISIKNREEKQNRKVNINPKFYHRIKEIFEKTLDRNPDNRYETAKELKSALTDAIALYNEKVYLISSCREVISNFVGRNAELKEIHNALQESDTVFLHGFGGIGKTELALKYAQKHKEDFDTIVFCKYENNLKDTLANINTANYNHQDDEKFLNDLPNLLNERVLIILDNFDLKKPNSDPYFKENFLKLNCKKIITTRRDFFRDLGRQISVNHLDKDSMQLFKQECEWNSADDGKEEIVKEIFNIIQSHTLFIVAVARMKAELDLSIEELLDNVKENLLDNGYEICDMNEETLKVIAEKLFNMDAIGNNDDETAAYQQVLRNLYALKWRTVTLNDYTEIACYGLTDKEKIKQQNLLNKLVRRGWVQTADFGEKQEYFLHPIMQELVNENCKKNNYSAESIVGYYQSKIECIKKRRVSGEERGYVLFFLIKEIIFLSDLLFTISLENIHIVIDFIEKAIRFKEYGFGIEHQLKENDLLHKVVGKINIYCLKNAPLEIHLKWVELLVIGGYYGHIIKYEECDYPKHCIILHNKLGISKKSKKKIKEQYWDIARTYILYIKEDLYKKGRGSDLRTEKELIRCVEDIKNIFNKGEKGAFDTFKNGESIIFDSEPEWPEMMNTNYQKYMQKINTLQSVVKEIYTDIVSDENMTYDEKQGLKLELVDNAVKQTNHEIVYNDIVESVEFTEDEKNELLQIVFADACTTLMENLEKHVGNKTDEYANVLISYSKRELEWLGRYETANRLQQGMFLGIILLCHYVKNKEEFITNLGVLVENLYIQYLGKNKGKLNPQCWRGICSIFSDINKLHVIYPFVNRSINIILDEQSGSYEFPFLQLLEELTGEVYEETNDEEYHKMQKQYKARMNEATNINYKIKD